MESHNTPPTEPGTNQTAGISYWQLMQNASFRNLWLGQTISQFGDGFYILAMMLEVSALTNGDVTAIGLVSMAFALPQLPIGLLGGALVDRVNRRQLMIVADLLRIGTTLMCMVAFRLEMLWLLYVMALIQAAISGLFFPAKNSLIPQIVQRHELMGANAMSQTTQVAAFIFGPALAGLTIDVLGVEVAFVVDAFTFLLSALFLIAMAPVPTLGQGQSSIQQTWQELKEGLSFTWNTMVVRNLTLITAVLFLGLGAVNVLWVPLMEQIFHVGAKEIGLIDGVQGLGMLLGSIALGTAAVQRYSPRTILLGGMMIVALGFIGLGLAPTYGVVLLVALFLGTGVPGAQASHMTMVQQVTPDHILGRVTGASGAVTNGAMLLSMSAASFLGPQIGLRESYIICGLLSVLSVGLGMWVLPTQSEAQGLAQMPPELPMGEMIKQGAD